MVDELIFCRKKGCRNPECHEHHYFPRAWGGEDSDGRVYLCKKHHDILHGMIINTLWLYIPEEKKEKCKKAIEYFGRWWVTQ
jgi:hypothetical protein